VVWAGGVVEVTGGEEAATGGELVGLVGGGDVGGGGGGVVGAVVLGDGAGAVVLGAGAGAVVLGDGFGAGWVVDVGWATGVVRVALGVVPGVVFSCAAAERDGAIELVRGRGRGLTISVVSGGFPLDGVMAAGSGVVVLTVESWWPTEAAEWMRPGTMNAAAPSVPAAMIRASTTLRVRRRRGPGGFGRGSVGGSGSARGFAGRAMAVAVMASSTGA